MASERNKRRSGKFFVNGGPVLISCKTPLTRKALSCLYFRKTKSEEHIVCDLFGYTGPTAKRWMTVGVHVMFPPFRTKLLSTAVEILCNGDVSIKISLWYSRVFSHRKKLKGSEDFSEDFNWNNIGLASLWFVWFSGHAWFRLMISCRLVI